MSRFAARIFCTLLLVCGARAQSVTPAIKADLVPTGTLRAAINYGNTVLAHRDPATGEITGVAVDLSRELGRRIGVPVQLVPFDAAGKMADAAKSGAWDIAYLAIDPARAKEIDFAAAYIEIEGTYLVPAGSRLHTVEDVDHDGIKVAVTTNSAYDLFLSRTIKHAQLIRAGNTPESLKLFADQKLDAVAGVRAALVVGSKGFPGSTVMAGHFMTIPQAAGVPKGRGSAAKYVSEFIEDMKASGFVAEALRRHGLQNDAVVAPAAPAR